MGGGLVGECGYTEGKAKEKQMQKEGRGQKTFIPTINFMALSETFQG